MKLNEIKFDELVIHTDHRNKGIWSRIVYFNPKTDQYIKLWNNDFFWKKYFQKAGQKFFEGISLLQDVIIDNNGNILGYITPKADSVNHTTLDKSKLNNLIERVYENSKKYNIIYVDFKPTNIVEKDSVYYLIDLEPAVPINELLQIPSIEQILQYNTYAYIKKIKPLLLNRINFDDKCMATRHQTFFNKNIEYGKADGRIFLEKEYLPKLSGKVLFAGVNYYTNFYHLLVKEPELFETLDCDEQKIEEGSPNIHYVCNILDFQNKGYLYDHVCCFGIFGHNAAWEITISNEEIIKCIENLDKFVKPGGTFLFGPATQILTDNYWDNIYASSIFKNYEIIMKKKIGINSIWHGRKK